MPTDPREALSAKLLADDCLVFADSVERQGTPWALGCARVLRHAAIRIRELNARLEVRREAAALLASLAAKDEQ